MISHHLIENQLNDYFSKFISLILSFEFSKVINQKPIFNLESQFFHPSLANISKIYSHVKYSPYPEPIQGNVQFNKNGTCIFVENDSYTEEKKFITYQQCSQLILSEQLNKILIKYEKILSINKNKLLSIATNKTEALKDFKLIEQTNIRTSVTIINYLFNFLPINIKEQIKEIDFLYNEPTIQYLINKNLIQTTLPQTTNNKKISISI